MSEYPARMADAKSPMAAPLPAVPDAESTWHTVNGVRLHAVTAGDDDAPLVVLLHGYPEFWYGWHDYFEPLVEAGYRVVAPDQRGYNRSNKPDNVSAYRISELSADIVDLIAAEGRRSAHVVGHDWGAAVGWDLALRHPEVVDRLGILNVPHPTVFEAMLKSNLRQLRKSWYMFFFQVPHVPEWVQRRGDFRLLVKGFASAESGTFTDRDIDRYRTAWSRPGAVTGMINWYRALFRHTDPPPHERVEIPTLVMWGERDSYLLPEMAQRSVAYCENGRLERFPDASHWVNHERVSAVTDLLTGFLPS